MLLSACTFVHEASYYRAYVPVEEPDYLSDGRALLYMTEEQIAFHREDEVKKVALNRLSMPLGKILHETALEVLEDSYSGGVRTSTTIENPSAYELIIQPEVTSFSAAYAGDRVFTVTPIVEVGVKVRSFDRNGQLVDERTFSSGPVKDQRCWGEFCEPAERAVMLTHMASYQVMKEAVRVMSMGTDSQERERESDAQNVGSQ